MDQSDKIPDSAASYLRGGKTSLGNLVDLLHSDSGGADDYGERISSLRGFLHLNEFILVTHSSQISTLVELKEGGWKGGALVLEGDSQLIDLVEEAKIAVYPFKTRNTPGNPTDTGFDGAGGYVPLVNQSEGNPMDTGVAGVSVKHSVPLVNQSGGSPDMAVSSGSSDKSDRSSNKSGGSSDKSDRSSNKSGGSTNKSGGSLSDAFSAAAHDSDTAMGGMTSGSDDSEASVKLLQDLNFSPRDSE